MTHTYTARVYLEDVDAIGCMYHANHLKFCERARTEMLRQYGFAHARSIADNHYFVVRHISIDYHRAVFLDDVIVVETEVIAVKTTQLTLQQKLMCHNNIIGQLVVQLVFVDNAFKVLKIPHELKTVCQHLCLKLNEDTK